MLKQLVSGLEGYLDLSTLLFEHENVDSQRRLVDFFLDASKTLGDPFLSRKTFFPGHATGSAFVVNQSLDRVLLMHHRKLNRWLQPGGHADGQEDLFQVAWRETLEETGFAAEQVVTLAKRNGGGLQARAEILTKQFLTMAEEEGGPNKLDKTNHNHNDAEHLHHFVPLTPSSLGQSLCFDIDLHQIPARSTEPEHYHFDFRYLLVVDEGLAFQKNDESNDLKWFSFPEAVKITGEESIARPLRTIRKIQNSILF